MERGKERKAHLKHQPQSSCPLPIKPSSSLLQPPLLGTILSLLVPPFYICLPSLGEKSDHLELIQAKLPVLSRESWNSSFYQSQSTAKQSKASFWNLFLPLPKFFSFFFSLLLLSHISYLTSISISTLLHETHSLPPPLGRNFIPFSCGAM